VGKLLLLVVLAVVGWLAFRLLRGAKRGRGPKPDSAASPEAMVTCARCGVAIPGSESVERDGRRVCRDATHCQPGP
jgi:hypothetical protein